MNKLNLLGIRPKATLCITKGISGTKVTIMRPITESQEKEIDDYEKCVIDGNSIGRADIYIYGEVNLDSPDDIAAINKFKLINDDNTGSSMHSNFDYEKGEVEYETMPKFHPTWNAVEWFKYNYCMIGKPERIIVYRIDKSLL